MKRLKRELQALKELAEAQGVHAAQHIVLEHIHLQQAARSDVEVAEAHAQALEAAAGPLASASEPNSSLAATSSGRFRSLAAATVTAEHFRRVAAERNKVRSSRAYLRAVTTLESTISIHNALLSSAHL